MFTPKYSLLDTNLRSEIENYAVNYGAHAAAEKYQDKTGMSFIGLYTRLQKVVKNVERDETNFRSSLNGGSQKKVQAPIRSGRNNRPPEKELSKEETALLDKISRGEVAFEEMRSLVARRVFEKMLKNPDDFRFLDFFRVELLKIKKEEKDMKESWAKELITKMFAGKLPPSTCPHCGFDFSDTKVLKGEEVEDESLHTSTGI